MVIGRKIIGGKKAVKNIILCPAAVFVFKKIVMIKTHLTYRNWKKEGYWRGEVNTQPSLTVPDQSMTVQEIQKRYASGIGWQSKTPLYEFDATGKPIMEIPDWNRMDLSEKQAFSAALYERIAEIQEALNKPHEFPDLATDDSKNDAE